MDLIIGTRGSGRTLRCFNYARENNVIIISDNARALRVKAKSLGYDDIEILAPNELNGDYNGHKALLYKWDRVLEEDWKFEEGIHIEAISFAEECTLSRFLV